MLLGVIVVAMLSFGVGRLPERFIGEWSSLDGRLNQWRLSLGMIKDHFIFGVGSGNYVWNFPYYNDYTLTSLLHDEKNAVRPMLFNHAHSDYLEILSEQGIIGFLLLSSAIGYFLFRIMNAYLFSYRHAHVFSGALYGSVFAISAGLIHETVDFSYQIPVNAAYLVTLLGTGLVAVVAPRQRRSRS